MKLPSKSRSRQASRLVDRNHETKWIHVPDAQGEANLDLANTSCRHCHGTGIAGQLMTTLGKPAVREDKDKEPLYQRVQLTCTCVVRQEVAIAELKEAAEKENELKQ